VGGVGHLNHKVGHISSVSELWSPQKCLHFRIHSSPSGITSTASKFLFFDWYSI
jgi:hypothetical protein